MGMNRGKNTLPRPATGDGEILITSGDDDVVLVWEKGNITRAHLASDPASNVDMKTLEGEGSAGISSCECCKRTDGGIRVCHAIPCGSVCD